VGLANTLNRRAKNASRQKHQLVVSVFQVFLSKAFFKFIFQKQIQFCVRQKLRRVMRTSVRTRANAKRLGRMSTAAYARSGSPGNIVNVMIIFKVKVYKNIHIRITFLRAIINEWKSNKLTLIETRKSRQIDNDDKKINMRKIYHICRLFVSKNYQSSKKSAYMVYFSYVYFFPSLSICISLLFRVSISIN
jgi:hypothetical protein